ncbi:hypothetical protein CSV78_04100 [Sporosarcina sp. P16a]|uniref:oligosaccharide flippase family protein n=1 Tax=unclassified Sporosarcina TaxID=2647733 RepID=UPI000C16EA9A|nr:MULTISPECIES: oligosaccharide flippase family protein [unclassified Sporosarcina]PIC67982.1 hypothetical protein CSV78_04100 [Sporosarcina sp. P16a]PIC94291.1 hypothetical protein CSV70_00740 [Sporosarcina sp. P25]
MKKNIYNFIILLLGSVLGSLLMFIAQIILARNFTVEDYGNFATVTNLVNIIAVFIGFGVGDFLVKVFAAEGRNASRWVRPSFKIFYISLVVSVTIVSILVLSDIYSPLVNYLILLFIPNIILQGLLTLSNAVNQIEENFLKNTLFNLLIYIVRFFSVLIALITTKSIITIGISVFILSILALFPFIRSILRLYKGNIIIFYQPHSKALVEENFKTTLKNILPFGLIGIFYYAYYQSDILIIAYYKGSEATGLYSAAFAILTIVYLFPNLLFRKLFLTKIHVWANYNNKKLFSFFRRSTLTMLLIGIITTTIIFIFSENIISIIYGEKYIESAIYLSLLSLCIVFRFIYSISGTIMSTKNNIYYKVKVQGATALINVLGNIILIPIVGVKGAIISTIFSELILCVCLYLGTKNYFYKLVKRDEIF